MSFVVLYLLFSMLAVIYFDATRFIIPNWLVGSLLLLYPITVFISPVVVNWQMDLLGMFGTFVIGYIIFALRMMGGGDVKLIIVLSLWVGLEKLPMFGFGFALIGGGFSIFILLIRGIISSVVSKNMKMKFPRIFRSGEPVPYGVAIAGAFLLMLFSGDIKLVGS